MEGTGVQGGVGVFEEGVHRGLTGGSEGGDGGLEVFRGGGGGGVEGAAVLLPSTSPLCLKSATASSPSDCNRSRFCTNFHTKGTFVQCCLC